MGSRARSRKGRRRAARRRREQRKERERMERPLLAALMGVGLTLFGLVLLPWAIHNLALNPDLKAYYLVREDLVQTLDARTVNTVSALLGTLSIVGGPLLLDRQRVGWLAAQMALLGNAVYIISLMGVGFDLVQLGGLALMLVLSGYLWLPSVRTQFSFHALGEGWMFGGEQEDDR